MLPLGFYVTLVSLIATRWNNGDFPTACYKTVSDVTLQNQAVNDAVWILVRVREIILGKRRDGLIIISIFATSCAILTGCTGICSDAGG